MAMGRKEGGAPGKESWQDIQGLIVPLKYFMTVTTIPSLTDEETSLKNV